MLSGVEMKECARQVGQHISREKGLQDSIEIVKEMLLFG